MLGGLLIVFSVPGLKGRWRDPALWPWLAFLFYRIVIAAAFFGYVRHGAAAVPVLAVLLGLGPLGRMRLNIQRFSFALALLLLGLEGSRAVSPPGLSLAGCTVAERPLFPTTNDVDRRLMVGR